LLAVAGGSLYVWAAKPKGHQLMPNLEQRQDIESNILGDGGDLEIDVELFVSSTFPFSEHGPLDGKVRMSRS